MSQSRKLSSFYARDAKRLLDLILAASILVAGSPILLAIAALVRLNLGSPVLYRHQRPGRYGIPFTLLKFRSMTDATNAKGELLSDEQRITRMGHLLRNSSLDELPELLNVLKGEMSIVGPRPLLMQYLGRYSDEQMRRHDVLPGITGWAQVHGRNGLGWEQKFDLDVWYVDHISFWLDIKILFRTVWKILTREGISQPGYISSEEFRGSHHRV